ncbi:hypothetical protein Q4512_10025 [Oceanihabitans sp. 2_MG-2023]|uniref:AAA family ATPase n=1 Tax=Oceanihabitans sp. 2_MG-2023 TaxID=3062661 RepID=UPI0026E1B0CF|nr:hypothetical protein [Oceanihabitans sp. 2_MG-2023]MDO6597250.1 hypothetical protein [Oceanihabitans sp. 2_MG-2023]
MRLAAVYILEHYLFDEPQVINLVGNYFYSINHEYEKITINRIKNDKYVYNLHSNNINELSAIVGANGSGKTTLFSIINKNRDTTRAIFIYENRNGEIKIVNRTGKLNENGDFTETHQVAVYFEKLRVNSVPNIDIPVLYFSPIPDEDLSDFSSSISKTSHFKSTLIEYHLDNIERSTMLMTDDIVDEIKKVYPELPLYNYLSLSAKPLYKRDLRNTHGGFKVTGSIEKTQKEAFEKLWESYPSSNKDKEHLTHDSSNFFKNIEVNILSYLIIDATSTETAFNGFHNISYFDIIKEDNFLVKLKQLFFHKIAHIDKYIYYHLKEAMVNDDYHILLFHFETTNFDEILKDKQNILMKSIESLKPFLEGNEIENFRVELNRRIEGVINEELKGNEFENLRDNLVKFSEYINALIESGNDDLLKRIKNSLKEVEIGIGMSFDTIYNARYEIIDQLKGGVQKAIKLFTAIQSFYIVATEFAKKDGAELINGKLNINLRIIDFADFKKLMQNYRMVLEEFNGNSLINAQILEFRPDKRFSYGEKSLLNLFSSFYEFTIRKHHYLRRKENYILLLDEADLGFHPLWKKRFVSAITKVIPVIFERLNIDIDNSKHPELNTRKIQIIISTHDPLTLSDIPNYNIVYIDRIDNDKSNVIHLLNDNSKPKQSFGANVHDLLAHSFFLKDGFIGEFAKEKIQQVLDNLSFIILSKEIEELRSNSEDLNKDLIKAKQEYHSDLEGKFLYKEKQYLKSIIDIVDEPILKYKMDEMYYQAFPNEIDKNEAIKRAKRILGDAGLNIKDLNEDS